VTRRLAELGLVLLLGGYGGDPGKDLAHHEQVLDRGHNISRRAAPRVAPGIVPPRLAVPKWAPPGCP
jgi:hypothetical protein